MFNANETWSEKDKQTINLKTTRNNLGNLSNTISQYSPLGSLNLIGSEQCSFKTESFPVRRPSYFHLYQGGGCRGLKHVGFMWRKRGEKVDLIQIQGTCPPIMNNCDWQKRIEMFKNQSGTANLYWPLWGCAWDWVQVLCRSNWRMPVKNVLKESARVTPDIVHIRETIRRAPRGVFQLGQEFRVVKVLQAAIFN